jgi:hypothetical protein
LNSLAIHHGKVESSAEGVCVSAAVDDRAVHFAFSGDFPFAGPSGDPFLAAAIVLAMQRGGSVSVSEELPVSERLIAGLQTYQEIYSQWYRDLRHASVDAAARREPAAPTGAVGTFFSGGVDGHYTLLQNRARVTHLILCLGLDIPHTEQGRWERTRDSVRRTASALGKRVCLVESNVKTALQSARFDNHGAVLASTALGLSFDRLLIPASHDYASEPSPWGSHHATDPTLSTGQTLVEYDGMVPRPTKVRRLVEAGVDLNDLRVCNRFTDFNCGHCEKCLRTMVALEVMDTSVASLPRVDDMSVIGRVVIPDEMYADFWDENLQFAQDFGRQDIGREIERALGRFRRRDALRQVDRAWFGGRISRLRSRFARGR